MKGIPHGEWVHALLEEGLSLDTLLLDLFAPTARRLGQLWEEDEADFLDVAVALGRLQSLTRAVCARLEGVDIPMNGRRVLLLPCPGETHLFSLALVASFFREAGWEVVLSNGVDQDPATLIHAERFDLVGISLSCDVLLPAMAEFVATLRGLHAIRAFALWSVARCSCGILPVRPPLALTLPPTTGGPPSRWPRPCSRDGRATSSIDPGEMAKRGSLLAHRVLEAAASICGGPDVAGLRRASRA